MLGLAGGEDFLGGGGLGEGMGAADLLLPLRPPRGFSLALAALACSACAC